jgi:hypothetical protein
MISRILPVAVTAAVAVANSASGAGLAFTSGPERVALIELYTSEGCSSCPPAEKWLGALRDDARLWKEFVPVAFHVNYWDRLGWRDVFASRAFTDRQYAYASAWQAASVYTPCFVRDGREWRTRDLRVDRPGTEVGTLDLARDGDVSPTGAARWRVAFHPAASLVEMSEKNFEAHVALLGGDIASDVRAGENAGRTLAHEFVALSLESAALTRDDAGVFRIALALQETDARAPKRRAIAAWITRRGELAPLQAVGGWLE